ncbi:MAG: lysine exporter LysO family protein [Bacteroidales bacterium]|nr:lysine exporter LysO family protein [Bacteroidales bacterium]
MKGSLIILSFFVVGIILGFSRFLPELLIENDYSMYALYALMLFVGISIGADTSALSVIKKVKYKILLVPAVVIIGSLLGAFAVSFFLPYKLNELFGVASGFGYYSLSSLILKDICGAEIATLALLSNIFREVGTLLLAPLMAIAFGKLAPIASGGATAMDSTLPIVITASGKEYAMISVFSGIVLTILVPFLVPLVVELF